MISLHKLLDGHVEMPLHHFTSVTQIFFDSQARRVRCCKMLSAGVKPPSIVLIYVFIYFYVAFNSLG